MADPDDPSNANTRSPLTPARPSRNASIAAPLARWSSVLAVLAVILIGSVTTSVPTPAGYHPSWVALSDLRHAVAYGTLGLVLAVATAPRFRSRARLAIVVFAVVVCIGAAVELVQAPLPHRTASSRDVLVNAIGATLGLGLYAVLDWARSVVAKRA